MADGRKLWIYGREPEVARAANAMTLVEAEQLAKDIARALTAQWGAAAEDIPMGDSTYTLAQWKVAAGRDADFVEAWKALGNAFRALPHPPTGEGLLLQSMTDSTLYYSFGPWDSAEDIAAMREDANAKAAIKRVIACCDEATPGGYRVIAKA